MDMIQWALHDIEICSICFFQVLTFFIFIFENRVILWVSINYPKPILKELFNLQLWSCTFFQHVTVLFHLYTSFKFLESFAYCVPLSASLRAGFSQNENIILAYLLILYERIILFSFSPRQSHAVGNVDIIGPNQQ